MTALPDASSPPARAELHCPLCEYNLRGLAEPRCPECGHAFDWDELRDWHARQHPWLFEHHPRRNVRSFFRTFLASVRPRRFWRSVRAIHTPAPKRMLLYWVLVGVLVIAGAWLGTYAEGVREYVGTILNNSRTLRATVERLNRNSGTQDLITARYGSVDAYLKLVARPAPSIGTIFRSPRFFPWWFRYYSIGAVVVLLLAWPWLTMATLLLFRRSLRQAQIRTAHVMRCAVYSADVLVLAGIVMTAGVVISVWIRYQPKQWWNSWLIRPLDEFAPAMLIMLGLLTYRLAVSYRLYLRFPHAVATVLASQVIVGLILMKVYLVWRGY